MKAVALSCAITVGSLIALSSIAANNQILGWNNLGMHCMDSDYSVFSILPPYNTIEAQLIVGGKLVTNGNGYTVTYQAIADPTGSFNSTAMGKGNFYDYATALYGAVLAPEAGLAGWSMPGISNSPQGLHFEQTNQPAAGVLTPVNWFRAEGIPLSPYDDGHRKNPYPMMRLIVHNATSQPIATNDIVLPVSDEMDCRACHASGTQDAAQPAAGWMWNGLPERDFRLNILRLHDERQFAEHGDLYQAALAAKGFNAQGLYRGVVADHKPVLCAACHASEALGAPSYGSIPALTTSIHAFHAHVADPVLSTTLDNYANRAACYRCHPGSTTKCLRGAMGGAVAADGSMAMQCQSCHGGMSTVGASNRVGWFMEPNCQNCHSGTATHNGGSLRYTTALDTNGLPRIPADNTFATQPNTPAPGLSLYRFSAGHGGLQCSACHGSTHAEFPSIHANDNVRNNALQGHAGVMVECTACHVTMQLNSTNAAAGPHGMHPVGPSWVSGHHDYIQGNLARCQACHGADNRGTVLSRAQGNRTLTASFDGGTMTLNLFRGALIGCYSCHNGPSDDNINNNPPPTVNLVTGNTVNSAPIDFTVTVAPPTATLRIIGQPANGTLGVSNNVLTYFPAAGYTGMDAFTYAAWDGAKNSLLATGTVAVAQGPYAILVQAHVPPEYPGAWPVGFSAASTVLNYLGAPVLDWDFGDGTLHSNQPNATHVYAAAGTYHWNLTATVAGASTTAEGNIQIGNPVLLAINQVEMTHTLSWPNTIADTFLEVATKLDAATPWLPVTNAPCINEGSVSVTLPATTTHLFRVNRPW